MLNELSVLVDITAIVLFILTLRGLSSAATSERGNIFGIIAMSLLILFCLGRDGLIIALRDHNITSVLMLSQTKVVLYYIATIIALISGGAIGYIIAKKINMTSLPQLVAAFHSLVGLSAVCIAVAVFCSPAAFGGSGTGLNGLSIAAAIEMSLGAAVGAVTFTGSVVAFGKLHGIISGKPLSFKWQHKINAALGLIIVIAIILFSLAQTPQMLSIIILTSLALGYLLIMPIGGADMPVIVSMLNSYSGWAAAGIGFTLNNNVLIIIGALVGTSGAILSQIMCKGMNRSLINVILGGVGGETALAQGSSKDHGNVKLCSTEDAAFIIGNAGSVIVVPGYGMAVAQAQHAIKEMSDILKAKDISVRYAIHPVAGRMPGHMNVLLAEANIPYEDVLEIDEINHEFARTDVVLVVGANDITNPAAKNDPTSPIYGMPILDVEKAKTVLFVKRSLASGYAGIDNTLFYQSNTMMVLGDAKKVCEGILRELK